MRTTLLLVSAVVLFAGCRSEPREPEVPPATTPPGATTAPGVYTEPVTEPMGTDTGHMQTMPPGMGVDTVRMDTGMMGTPP